MAEQTLLPTPDCIEKQHKSEQSAPGPEITEEVISKSHYSKEREM